MKESSKLKRTLTVSLIVLIMIGILLIYQILRVNYPSNILTRIVSGAMVVITPAIIALVICYLMEPMTKVFLEKYKMKKWVAIALTELIVIAVIGGIIALLVLFVIKQSQVLIEGVIQSGVIDEIIAFVEANNLMTMLNKMIDNIGLVDTATALVKIIISSAMTILLTPIFLWYFLKDRDLVFRGMKSVLPDRLHFHYEEIGSESNIVIRQYFRSKFISMGILCLMFAVLFTLLGIEWSYLLLFTLIITILDLIPFIGPFVGNVIPIIYFFAIGGTNLIYVEALEVNAWVASIILVSINLIIQFLQNNIIMPKLAGKEMHIHPLLILVSMLFFGSILGLWGVVLSIPLCGIISVIFRHLRKVYGQNPMNLFDLDSEPIVTPTPEEPTDV